MGSSVCSVVSSCPSHKRQELAYLQPYWSKTSLCVRVHNIPHPTGVGLRNMKHMKLIFVPTQGLHNHICTCICYA